jgi:hypothetical protein
MTMKTRDILDENPVWPEHGRSINEVALSFLQIHTKIPIRL